MVGNGRLEAFSDGIITIMVLELKVPHDTTLVALQELLLARCMSALP